MKKKIFVSGALNADSVEFLENCGRMLKYSAEIRQMGAHVYCPCCDILLGLMGGFTTHQECLEEDLAWLEDCDALALVPGSDNENSKGVAGEIAKAEFEGKPILKTKEELKRYLKGELDEQGT